MSINQRASFIAYAALLSWVVAALAWQIVSLIA